MRTALSVQGVTVRLTEVAVEHIAEEHPEIADIEEMVLETIARPERVVAGKNGELIAIRPIGHKKWIAAVYRLLETDGFVITAFFLDRAGYYLNRRQLWP
jgi:hypothetical protein